MSDELGEGICDGCGETAMLTEVSGAPLVGACMCAQCLGKGSEMPVVELAPPKPRVFEENANALSAKLGGKAANEEAAQ